MLVSANLGPANARDVLARFLEENRDGIVDTWVRRLHTEGGALYARRPVEELLGTVSEAFAANYQVLVHGDFSPIDRFIDKITRLRLESGFPLSAVQKAFELFREIGVPLLAVETPAGALAENIATINRCLAYTIHRFSDHFQEMNQKKILDQNRRLEEMVRLRTAALAESERKYKILVEEINDGYFVIQDESIAFANQAFCRMHGCDIEEVVGRHFIDFVAPASRDRVLDIARNRSDGGSSTASKVFGYDRLTKAGGRYPTEIQAKMIVYDGKLSSIGICRDITQRVRMEQRVRESERMAYIGQITTSLSHEIRNPLSAVKLNLQVLKKNPQIEGNDRRRIDISEQEVIRLERILNQLLDFAKPIRLDPALFSLSKLVSEYAELLEMKFKEKNLLLETVFDPQAPPVCLDRGKFGQMLINILLNAIEVSEPSARIVVRTAHRDGHSPAVEVIVEDEGHGFSDELAADMFKPFFTTKSKGTGLGLANALRIAEAHGGTILSKNRRHGGAVFTIRLPAGEDHGQGARCR
jgi:PAS domain S-box-containing protein